VRVAVVFGTFVLALFLLACANSDSDRALAKFYPLPLPPGFPQPTVSVETPVTAARAELGRHLFYDKELSANGTTACASCHVQANAFADPRTIPIGSTGAVLPRNGQGLANVMYAASLTWATPTLTTLEKQVLIPMFSDTPVELGWNDRTQEQILQRVRLNKAYRKLFAEAFPGQTQADANINAIVLSLAAFQRTLVSGRSSYDRYAYDKDVNAMSTEAVRGMELFFSERTECYHCHTGVTFGGSFVSENVTASTQFENNGLYAIYPLGNNGLFEFTQKEIDRGRFRVPSLRNVEVTAPYMHDGSIATLENVLEHYMAGGRNITEGPNTGDGRKNPNKSNLVRAFALDAGEREALLAFLKSLTDQEFLRNPKHANPWQAP
jgi:cytochrome c peroxidase